MRRFLILGYLLLSLVPPALAAGKPHVITFGKSSAVPWFVGAAENTKLEIRIRPLYVDGKLKEFTTGEPRDITDRNFVVRRAYRINDALPQESKTSPRWKWQRGGWLLVDRQTGRISQLNLPDFDPFYSATSWYRDFAAYCGIADDGEKVYAIVTEIGRKKPLIRRMLAVARSGDMPDSECDAPTWERSPVRVTFTAKGGQALTFQIRGQTADLVPTPPDSDE